MNERPDTKSSFLHTPGPWRAAMLDDWQPLATEWHEPFVELGHMAFDAVNIFVPAREDNDPINCEWAEFEANCNLIASAPDLLMALAWLVDLKDNRPPDYEEQKILAWDAARTAIRKATKVSMIEG